MRDLDAVWMSPAAEAIGMALVHFLWQGLVIGIFLALSLASLRGRSANSRYGACLIAMLLLLAAPAVTAYLILLDLPVPWDGAARGLWALGEDGAPGWLAPVLPALTGFWLLGASLLQLRLLINWCCAERIKRRGTWPADPHWQRHLDDLRTRLGVRKAVRVLESALVQVPAVVGWLSPVVLLPVGIAANLNAAQLRAVLAHELAHIRRHDYLVNLLQSVLESLLFFHPVTWWVSRRIRAEREFCCDDIALAVCDSPLQYARALSCLEELRGAQLQTVLAVKGGSLMTRTMRLFTPRDTAPSGPARWLAPAVVFAGVVTLIATLGTGCSVEVRAATRSAAGFAPPILAENLVNPNATHTVGGLNAQASAARVAQVIVTRFAGWAVRRAQVAAGCCPPAGHGAASNGCCAPARPTQAVASGCCAQLSRSAAPPGADRQSARAGRAASPGVDLERDGDPRELCRVLGLDCGPGAGTIRIIDCATGVDCSPIQLCAQLLTRQPGAN